MADLTNAQLTVIVSELQKGQSETTRALNVLNDNLVVINTKVDTVTADVSAIQAACSANTAAMVAMEARLKKACKGGGKTSLLDTIIGINGVTTTFGLGKGLGR